jgi:hypothetical protein
MLNGEDEVGFADDLLAVEHRFEDLWRSRLRGGAASAQGTQNLRTKAHLVAAVESPKRVVFVGRREGKLE